MQNSGISSRPPPHTVGAVHAALRIMRHLGDTGKPVRLVEITRALDLNPSTCLNILRTLADNGFVEHQPLLKTWALGPSVLDLARNFLIGVDEHDRLQPLLDDFSRRNRASVALWRRHDDRELVTVAHSGLGALVQLRALVGTRVPILTGSMGRALASAEDCDHDWLLARFGEAAWKSSNDFSAFLDGVRMARRKGWAADQGTYGGVAVPLARNGRVEFIISIMFFGNQLSEAQIEAVGSELLALAPDIAQRLYQRGVLPTSEHRQAPHQFTGIEASNAGPTSAS